MAIVTIGLPVFNGDVYLDDAIASLRAQTFQDLEIIISDNASTDGTPEICRRHASQDHRIRYESNETNIGASANFNRTFFLSDSPYFKWAAHDDICEPTFIERCVDALEADAGAVIAYSKVCCIDADGAKVGEYDPKLNLDSPEVQTRFESLLRFHSCYEIFGLIRSSVLDTTDLIGGYAHGDGVLLCQLALRGRFVRIPEFLFLPRRHSQQSMALLLDSDGNFSPDYHTYAAWFDPALSKRILFPWWRMHAEIFRSLFSVRMDLSQRSACIRHFIRWLYNRRRFFYLDLKHNLRIVLRRPT